MVLLLAESSNLHMCLQPSVHEGAELEMRRLQELQKEDQKKREEHLEKARLRGKRALRMEHLEKVQLPRYLRRRWMAKLFLRV